MLASLELFELAASLLFGIVSSALIGALYHRRRVSHISHNIYQQTSALLHGETDIEFATPPQRVSHHTRAEFEALLELVQKFRNERQQAEQGRQPPPYLSFRSTYPIRLLA